MKKNIQDALITIIADALVASGYSLPREDLYLDLPSDIRFGEFSTNAALKLSRQVRKSSLEIAAGLAEKIKARLEKSDFKDCIRQVKVEGPGFINFYLENNYFYEYLQGIVRRKEGFLREDCGKNKRVLIEFVSANPTGPLSVAHARQAAVGDVLANILDFLGFKVKREYYLNDEGNQINILGASIELRLKELNGQKIDFPQNYYQGDYICQIAGQIKDGPRPIKDFSTYGAEYILGIIKKELDDLGVVFDNWYSQKKLRESGKIRKALDFLKKKGFIYEQDGALWFKSTEFGDDKDRVVIKSDGSYTYLAPDIAYHQEKYRRGFSWLINIWGPDHHGYINRLKAAVQAQGKAPESLSIIIVQLATIFKDGKVIEMSTRRGQYVTLREVLDEVGSDAARFFFIMRRTSSHLDFDLGLAKKQTAENPVYYVQYAYARISSILRTSLVKVRAAHLDLGVLREKEELALIRKLWQFSYILNICFKTGDPYMLTVYLQGLAESFHIFYDRHRVLGQADELTQSRLYLIEATKIVLSCGFKLLGVSSPDKM